MKTIGNVRIADIFRRVKKWKIGLMWVNVHITSRNFVFYIIYFIQDNSSYTRHKHEKKNKVRPTEQGVNKQDVC